MSFQDSLRNIPPVTRNLIGINLLIWLFEILLPGFAESFILKYLGLHYITASYFQPAELFTYMFVHDNHSALHILFNMFTLWMFGRILEQVWGSKRFLWFYIVCGVGAALVQELIWSLTWFNSYVEGIATQNLMTVENMRRIVESALQQGDARFEEGVALYKNSLLTIGASGAIFGLLLGFAFVFPNMPLYLFFIPIPIKAKYMVIGYGLIEFFLGVVNSGSTVAHFAHLGGMLFGLVLLLYWRKKGTLHGNGFY